MAHPLYRGVIRRLRPLRQEEIARLVLIASSLGPDRRLGTIRRMVSLELFEQRRREHGGS